MLIGNVGLSGSGKTTMMIARSYKAYESGVQVYSNMKSLKFPFTYYNTLEEMYNIKNAYIIADELWMSIDSRVAGSRRNRVMSYLLNQIRKNNVILEYTAQQLHSIDKRIRDNTRYLHFPEFKTIENKNFPKGYIRNKVYELDTISGYKLIQCQKINPIPYWQLFDTKELVSPILIATEDKEKEKEKL